MDSSKEGVQKFNASIQILSKVIMKFMCSDVKNKLHIAALISSKLIIFKNKKLTKNISIVNCKCLSHNHQIQPLKGYFALHVMNKDNIKYQYIIVIFAMVFYIYSKFTQLKPFNNRLISHSKKRENRKRKKIFREMFQLLPSDLLGFFCLTVQ